MESKQFFADKIIGSSSSKFSNALVKQKTQTEATNQIFESMQDLLTQNLGHERTSMSNIF